MRFDILRQPLGLVFALVVGLLALFAARSVGLPLPAETLPNPTGPLGTWLDNRVGSGPTTVFLTCTLLLICGFYVTRIVTRHMVLVVRTYQSALFFVLTGGGILLPQPGLSIALAAFLLILGSELMIAGFQRRPTYDRFFRAGLALGLAPLFYAPAVISFPMLFAGLIFFRRTWRETIVGTVGYLLPFATYCYAGWLAGLPLDLPLWMMTDALTIDRGFSLLQDAEPERLIMLGVLLALTLLSFTVFLIYLKKTRTRARRIFYYFTLVMAVSGGCFLLPGSGAGNLFLLAIPLSVIAPNYFVRFTGLVPGLVYLFLLLGMVGVNLIPFL